MGKWQRLRAVGDFWMNDPGLAAGARFKSRLMGPTILAAAVVAGIVGSWGVFALCLIFGLLLVAHGWSGRTPPNP